SINGCMNNRVTASGALIQTDREKLAGGRAKFSRESDRPSIIEFKAGGINYSVSEAPQGGAGDESERLKFRRRGDFVA
ncbi:hypothetical protein L0F63_003308, partial [Massospora cicadina]